MSRRGSGNSWKPPKSSEKSVNTDEELLLCQQCREKISNDAQSGQKVMLKEYLKSIEYINSCHSLLNQIVARQEPKNNFTLPDIPNFVSVFSMVYNQFGNDGKKTQPSEKLDADQNFDSPINRCGGLDEFDSLDDIYSRIDSLDTNEELPAEKARAERRNQELEFHRLNAFNSNIPRPVSCEKTRKSAEEKVIFDKARRQSAKSNEEGSSATKLLADNGRKEDIRRNSDEGSFMGRLNRQRIIRQENKAVLLERNKSRFSEEISEDDLDKYAKELLRSRSESPNTPRSLSSNSRDQSPDNTSRTKKSTTVRQKLKTGAAPPKMTYKLQQKISPTLNETPGRMVEKKSSPLETKMKSGNDNEGNVNESILKLHEETPFKENFQIREESDFELQESDREDTLTSSSVMRIKGMETFPEIETQDEEKSAELENDKYSEAEKQQQTNSLNENPLVSEKNQQYLNETTSEFEHQKTTNFETANPSECRKKQCVKSSSSLEKQQQFPNELSEGQYLNEKSLEFEKQKRLLSEKLLAFEQSQHDLLPNLGLGAKQSKHQQLLLKKRFLDEMKKQFFPESSEVDTDRDVMNCNLLESSDDFGEDGVFEKKSLNSNRSSKADNLCGGNNTYNLLKMSVSRPLRTKSVLSKIGILTNSGRIKPEKEQELAKIKSNLSKDTQSFSFRQPRNRLRESQSRNPSRIKIDSNFSSPASEIKSDEDEVPNKGHFYKNKF